MPRKAPDTFRDRVQEFKRVPVAELLDHTGNFRRHPQAQQDALAGVLRDIGIAGALTAYYSAREGGALTLIDGHLRKSKGGTWPVLILDVDDAEADLLLATHDELAAMADKDAGPLKSLLERVSSGEAAVQAMLARMAEDAGIIPQDDPLPDEGDAPIETIEENFQILITCADEAEQRDLLTRFEHEGLRCKALLL